MKSHTFNLLPIVLIALCGCTRMDGPTSRTEIVPADLHQGDDRRSIDLSLRFTGDDEGIRDLYQLAITREFEDGGYILVKPPRTNPPSSHAKLQIEVYHDNDSAMTLLSGLTWGVVPEMRGLLTTITARAVSGQATKVYEEKIVGSSFRWLPFAAALGPSLYPDIAEEEHASMREITRLLIQRMRTDGMLARGAHEVKP